MAVRGAEGAAGREPPAAPQVCGPDADGAVPSLRHGHGRDLAPRARASRPSAEHDRAARDGLAARRSRPRTRHPPGSLNTRAPSAPPWRRDNARPPRLPRLASRDLDAERRTGEVATEGTISPTSRSA